MSPASVPEGHTRGFIIPIGGAEDKVGDDIILKRFVELAGGRDARLVVIPTASELRDTGRRDARIFEGLRARSVAVLPFESRRECEDAESLAKLGEATGVFLTGGNQLRLSTVIGGTAVAKALRRRNAAGVHVAGTSAGAAFLSEHMIAFGDEGSTPRSDMVTLAPGLGLSNRVIVDQHFRQRDRLGRLLAALSYNPFAVGVGLDEDTAAFLDHRNHLEVVGSGAITLVDPSEVQYSSMDSTRKGEPVTLLGVRVHVLAHGAGFDVEARQAWAAGARAR